MEIDDEVASWNKGYDEHYSVQLRPNLKIIKNIHIEEKSYK